MGSLSGRSAPLGAPESLIGLLAPLLLRHGAHTSRGRCHEEGSETALEAPVTEPSLWNSGHHFALRDGRTRKAPR